MSTASDVAAYYGLDGLKELEPDWRRITSHDSRYWIQFPFFFEVVRNARFGADKTIFFAVRDQTGVTQAIVPTRAVDLVIRRTHFFGLELIGSSITETTWQMSSVDFPISSAVSAADVLRTVVVQSKHISPRLGLLFAGRLTKESNAYGALNALGRIAILSEVDDGHKKLSVNCSYSQINGSLSSRFRSSLRTCYKKLSSAGEIQFFRNTPDEPEFAARYSEFLKIEDSGWKGPSGSRTSLLSARVQEEKHFFDALTRLEDGATAELFTMTVGGKTVASQLWWLSGSTRATFRLAYLEDYAQYKPGHLLFEHILQLCCEDPSIHEVDFVSDAEWLGVWRFSRELHFQYYIPIKPLQGALARTLLRLPSREQLLQKLREAKSRFTKS